MDVLIFEEHSSALVEWWRRGLRGATLICLDAHLDLQWVNPARLRRLEECATADAVERLAKPHHLLPDSGYSFGLEDFLWPAYRLGLIRRLVWVAPPHVEIGYSAQVVEQLQQMDGVSFDELTGFRETGGGRYEGQLLGVPITICEYKQLRGLSLPRNSLLDIDTDYFVTVPGDEAWVDVKAVYDELSRLPLQPQLVTIARSVESGFTPLRYRFFADYLAALWQGHARAVAHYGRLSELQRRLRAGDRPGVSAAGRRELAAHPHCAATHYLLSLSESDSRRAASHRLRAADADSSYRFSPLRSTCEILNRRLPIRATRLAELTARIDEPTGGAEDRALARAAVGLIRCAMGQVRPALEDYQQCVARLGDHPELALEIGKLLQQSGQVSRSVEFLQIGLQDDKTRTAAHVSLGQLCEAQGELGRALQHLAAAHDAAPAWGEVLRMLARVHRRLGDEVDSDALQQRFTRQQAKIDSLLRHQP